MGKGPAAPKAPESMPKKPQSAFEAYAKELAAEGKSAALPEMHKAFAALPDDEKKRRQTEADERKQKYKADCQTWENSVEGKRFRAKTKSFLKSKKLKYLRAKFLKGEPKKPQSAYFIFVAENRAKITAENPDAKGLGDVMKLIGDKWKNMSEDDKKVFTEKEKSDKEE